MLRPHVLSFILFVFAGSIFASGLCRADDAGQDAAEQSAPATNDQRHVSLAGQPNFRDIGGYRTRDGERVAWGRVYRSGRLPTLTDDDLLVLQQLDIGTVVNFLTDAEVKAAGADRVPPGTKQVSRPIETNDGMVSVVQEARRTADFSKVDASLNPEFHRMLVEQARPQYAALIREIIHTERPLVFHCSHGIHRTGTATAILLWAVGVPWETIREDYLLSNECRREEVQKRLAQLRQMAADRLQIAVQEVDMTNLNAFYILQPHYIDTTREQILSNYGGIDRYLTDGLGLSSEEISQLRTRLLEPDRPDNKP